jgi:putative ABC transport system permease protein
MNNQISGLNQLQKPPAGESIVVLAQLRWKLQESFLMALGSIREHLFRSVLTLLGIIIGVSTVIAVVSVIEGLNGTISKAIRNLNPNIFIVTRVSFEDMSPDKFQEALRKRPPLLYEDAVALRKTCPSVRVVSPFLTNNFAAGASTTVKFGNEDASNPILRGVEPFYQDATGLYVIEGRFIADADNLHHRDVCVLGASIADGLFKNANPVGKMVRIDSRAFQVIGVLERRETLMEGPSENQLVIIPFGTYEKYYPRSDQDFMQFLCSADTPENVEKAIDEVTESLRRRRNVPISQPDNFFIFTPSQMLELWHQISDGIFLLMILIASIALVIGGIGVMNIMWVSVNERIQEIGIRKAVGARRTDILWQFLLEAVLLTGAGGVLGILTGVILGMGFRVFFPTLRGGLSMWSVLAGLSVSVGVGLFFGIWPAHRAGKLDPIEALRYER